MLYVVGINIYSKVFADNNKFKVLQWQPINAINVNMLKNTICCVTFSENVWDYFIWSHKPPIKWKQKTLYRTQKSIG